MPNGSRIRVVADTNIYFMFLHNPKGKSALLIGAALKEKAELFSPDTVREELRRLLIRKGFNELQAEETIIHLPVSWVERNIYSDFMNASLVIKHKPDRPLLAVALALGYGIITANRRHFLPARKLVKIWEIDDLLEALNNHM